MGLDVFILIIVHFLCSFSLRTTCGRPAGDTRHFRSWMAAIKSEQSYFLGYDFLEHTRGIEEDCKNLARFTPSQRNGLIYSEDIKGNKQGLWQCGGCFQRHIHYVRTGEYIETTATLLTLGMTTSSHRPPLPHAEMTGEVSTNPNTRTDCQLTKGIVQNLHDESPRCPCNHWGGKRASSPCEDGYPRKG